jgi:hypothetical protein
MTPDSLGRSPRDHGGLQAGRVFDGQIYGLRRFGFDLGPVLVVLGER